MKKYFSFTGRIGRLEFFYIVLFYNISAWFSVSYFIDYSGLIALGLIIIGFVGWIFASAVTRRFHDLDNSGWNAVWVVSLIVLYNFLLLALMQGNSDAFGVFIAAIAFILIIPSFRLLFIKGTVGENKYGEDSLTQDSEIKMEKVVVSSPIVQQSGHVKTIEQINQSSDISTFSITDGDRRLLYFALVVGIAIVFFIIIIIFIDPQSNSNGSKSLAPSSDELPKGDPIELPKEEPITNPVYLKNPSEYLVDRENIVEAEWPVDSELWVEKVEDSAVLLVSYPVVKVGQNILIVRQLKIPALMQQNWYPAVTVTSFETIKCLEDEAMGFLNRNLLHEYVYLIHDDQPYTYVPSEAQLNFDSGHQQWLLQMIDSYGKNKISVAEFVIANGYGSFRWGDSGYNSKDYYDTSNYIVISFDDKDYLSYSAGHRRKNLYDQEVVAKLAKRGFWGICK